MIRTHYLLIAAGCFLAATHSAAADDETIGFRLITHPIETSTFMAPELEGHVIGIMDAKGSAVFDDGRVADKTFVYSFDLDKGVGSGHGYSVYSFVDGSSISARFDTTVNADGVLGIYTVLGGTGMYDGASGTGSFQSAAHPWEGASLFDGEFKLVLP